MFGLSTPEMILILAIALIVFGPKKLPEIGKSIGQGLRELRKASREIMDSVNLNDLDDDLQPVRNNTHHTERLSEFGTEGDQPVHVEKKESNDDATSGDRTD